MGDVKKYSEVSKRRRLEGEFVPFDKILDQEVVVTEIKKLSGNHGPYLLIQVTVDKIPRVTTCGGSAIVDKMQEVQEDLPLLCTFYKKGRYYDVK